MNKYNLEYETNGKTIKKQNLTKEQVQEFINQLKRENESSLRVKQVKEVDDERSR